MGAMIRLKKDLRSMEGNLPRPKADSSYSDSGKGSHDETFQIGEKIDDDLENITYSERSATIHATILYHLSTVGERCVPKNTAKSLRHRYRRANPETPCQIELH
jgi:hypothetical protein